MVSVGIRTGIQFVCFGIMIYPSVTNPQHHSLSSTTYPHHKPFSTNLMLVWYSPPTLCRMYTPSLPISLAPTPLPHITLQPTHLPSITLPHSLLSCTVYYPLHHHPLPYPLSPYSVLPSYPTVKSLPPISLPPTIHPGATTYLFIAYPFIIYSSKTPTNYLPSTA